MICSANAYMCMAYEYIAEFGEHISIEQLHACMAINFMDQDIGKVAAIPAGVQQLIGTLL